MKVSKAVQDFAIANNLQIVPITYRTFGKCSKRKGFDLIDKDRNIFASLEPRFSMYVKWYLRNGSTKSGNRNFYRITETVLNDLIWGQYPSKLK